MSSKHKYSRQDIISIHQFMNMCGLNYDSTSSTISHKKLCKGLKYQNNEIFGQIKVPIPLSYRTVTPRSLKIGIIVLVEDDYGRVCPYQKPQFQYRKLIISTDPSKQEIIRERIIKDMSEENIPAEVPLKQGETRYIEKKTKKRQVEDYIDMLIEKEIASYEELGQEEKAKRLKLMF